MEATTAETAAEVSRLPEPKRTLTKEFKKDGLFRVLSLDGGGAKGFYTLGVLKEIEGMLKCPLHQCFDLIFGTSTGSIIGALLALGFEIDEIAALYRKHVPSVMTPKRASKKSAALANLASTIFRKATFEDVKTGIGVVATKWVIERPMIFKGGVVQEVNILTGPRVFHATVKAAIMQYKCVADGAGAGAEVTVTQEFNFKID